MLQRIHQLAPDEGNELILAELRRLKPRATIKTFQLLPAGPMPDLDNALVRRLEEETDAPDNERTLAATLAARFGSPAIYRRVLKVYRNENGYWGSRTAALLAYLLHHNPKEGTALINQALDAKKKSPHVRDLLMDMASVRMSPELERIAIDHLEDRNRDIVQNAISLLREHGSAEAEQPLWGRLEKLHSTWKDRVPELKNIDPEAPANPVAFEQSLVYALAHAKGWFIDRERLLQLRKICLTSQKEVDQLLEAWREPVMIQFQAGADGEFPSAPPPNSHRTPLHDYWWVTQYYVTSLAELKTLLARFPTGTTFCFPVGMLTDPAAEQKVFDS